MNKINETFKYKKINFEKLLKFGFEFDGQFYCYEKEILSKEFILKVKISKTGNIQTQMEEADTKEPYTLYLVDEADGEFVGQIKKEFDDFITFISEKCTDTEIFKTLQAKKIIEYIQNKYNVFPEYLWEKFPNNAIFRRKDNSKWFGAILTTTAHSILKNQDKSEIEVIDLKCDDIEKFVDNKKIFPGYHMNKKHWISIILDNRLNDNEIYKFIDLSFNLTK